MRAKLRALKEELQRRMHEPISLQGKWLRQVVRGYFAYHAVLTNCKSMSTFRHYVMDLWRRALQRRSQRDRSTWERMALDVISFVIRWSAFGNTRNHSIGQFVSVVKMAISRDTE